MRLLRLVFEPGPAQDEVALDLHPGMTVVAGMGGPERRALIAELLGALGGPNPGVRLELEGVVPEAVPDRLAGLHLGSAGARRVLLFGTGDLERGRDEVPASPDALHWASVRDEEIEAASRMRRQVDALEVLSGQTPTLDESEREALMRVLVHRLAEARSFRGEGVPVILDEPFEGVDPAVTPLLLELLGSAAGDPQLILLTDDERVASWARLEALAGTASVVEPVSERV